MAITVLNADLQNIITPFPAFGDGVTEKSV